MGAKILAVDDNEINLKVVKTTLTQVGYDVLTSTNGVEALEMVESMHFDLIVLDISMPIMDGYEVCRSLRSNPKTSNIAVIMITAYNAIEDKIKGFEAGADDYLTKPFQPAELQARVNVVLRRNKPVADEKKIIETQKNAKVISFFSMKGGSGVSTMAANVSSGIAKIWTNNVALVDLSLSMGQAALMLNLSLRNTWEDLTNIPVNEIEADILDAVMLKNENGVHVLAAPRKIASGELITTELVTHVLDLLQTMYDYVVIDLPSNFSESTLLALDQSDEIICIFAPELASVRAMIGTLEVFEELGYRREKEVVMMLNRTFEKRGLARKNVEKALKQPIKIFVPFASEDFVNSINFGVPIVMAEPEHSLVELFEDVSFILSRKQDKETTPRKPSDAYQRVSDRFEKRKQRRR
ncbi:MAG: response regulator [Anaerolineaceae bacterium]|nr:response regulator [Anaerolineaceae bacterium]